MLYLLLALPLLFGPAGTPAERDWDANPPRADTTEVVMTTTAGEMVLELYEAQAPLTVKNFLRYVDGGHFDGAEFYRTVRYETDNGSPPIEVIQGGLNGRDAPFAPIAHEPTNTTGILHTSGVISMARGGVGTASSEIFICIGDQPGLDHGQPRNADNQGFAAFGRVVAGMEVVRKIHQAPSDAPTESDYVKGQIIEEPVRIVRVRRAAARE